MIKRIADAFVALPDGFTVHPKLMPLLQKRAAMASEGGIDWAMGELFAFGSLLLEGKPIRLAGQDTGAAPSCSATPCSPTRSPAREWMPLAHLDEGQARFWIYDSLLSEFAAMGFEYGYSVARPDALVLWEAQFGDFFNGAQTIIDEFISASEQKWGQRSSVVLLLPHGFEGQGPDHSSGRIERFLQMCAEDNMTVAYPSTPASYFHLLRWHAYHEPRRPLIVFTPKSMLRLKAAASPVEDFTSGTFRPVIPETEGGIDPAACAGCSCARARSTTTCSPSGPSGRARAGSRSRSSGSSSSRRWRAPRSPRPCRRTPTPSSSGCRRSRPTRGSGRSWRSTCRPPWRSRPVCVSRPPSASPAAGSHQKHDLEQRGAGRAAP